MIKMILNKAKGGYFRAGPTWMQRGTQGHVAAPCGPTRRLRGDVTHIYIYIYSGYNIYSLPIIGRDLLTL